MKKFWNDVMCLLGRHKWYYYAVQMKHNDEEMVEFVTKLCTSCGKEVLIFSPKGE